MHVSVQSLDRLNVVALPEAVGGAHWIDDSAGNRLAFVEGRGGIWHVEACEGLSIRHVDSTLVRSIDIAPDSFIVFNIEGAGARTWCLVFQPEDAASLETAIYGFEGDIDLPVGRSLDNVIVYANGFVSGHHFKLAYRNRRWYVADAGSTNGSFLNGRRLEPRKTMRAKYGDVVTALGLRITLGAGFFSCNCPNGDVRINGDRFVRYRAPRMNDASNAASASRPKFYPALRFPRSIERKQFIIDPPPPRERVQSTALIQRIGPSLIMGGASLLSMCLFVMIMVGQDASPLRAVPLAIMAAAMLVGCVVWPIIDERTKQEQREAAETKRRVAYSQYLGSILSEIARESQLQRAILEENRLSVHECLRMADSCDAGLMGRTPRHDDFLELRIGIGNEPLAVDIVYPHEHFTVEDDELQKEVESLARQPYVLEGVPIVLPLVEKRIVGIVGARNAALPFAYGMVAQVIALHSYEDVKLVVLCDEDRRSDWDFALHVPHCFSDDKSARFFASGPEGVGEVAMFLERVIEDRHARGSMYEMRESIRPFYVVVCDCETAAGRLSAMREVAEREDAFGVMFVSIGRTVQELPKECRSVISVGNASASVLDRDDPTGQQRAFYADIGVSKPNMLAFAQAMARIRLDLGSEGAGLPTHLGFLEMLHAGNVGHVNVASRWATSNASASLACQVGVDESGQPIVLNLHEKYHGPHGLIAGTTGSGKSEFIITFVLSMAMTYSPDDVAFVLIDYKGGGLAKAFDNEHVRLPHLAGAITNLDGAAIRRSLVSIQSELKRRQALFNAARDIVGGDNVDIYSYLDLYRQGRVSEPCPHLFIIADEFAELKQQEPEFMDELISAARIGRSLGVHLILATQKPTGVVNDQIWSNARFKVCLKVADAADSIEMIRRPDAAELQEAGRFYLLVGYNEFFTLGQAAYAGTRYVSRERYIEPRDDSVVLISDTGHALVTVKPRMADESGDMRPESVVVLAMIERIAAQEGLAARRLWLDPVPAVVTVDELVEAYAGGQVAGAGGNATGGLMRRAGSDGAAHLRMLDPVIGEYDDPNRQLQGLLRLKLAEEGNAVVYGSAESGVELVLASLAYSLFNTYDATQLNVYALDFGSGFLRAFAQAPQMGDVVGVDDDEKVARFFEFFESRVANRRARLAPFGGSFERYCREHDDMESIVVLLNDVAAFLEVHPECEERLVRLVRETGHNGIHLVATAANMASVRMRMRQAFRQVLAVNLAEANEYSILFGFLRGAPLPRGFGRGLAVVDGVPLEFQAAHLAGDGDDFNFAARFSARLASAWEAAGHSVAEAISIAPSVVEPQAIAPCARRDFMPYGIYDDDLSVAGFDFSESLLARCQFQRRKDGAAFVRAAVQTAVFADGWDVVLLDMAHLMGSEMPDGCKVATEDDAAARAFLEDAFAHCGEGERQTLLVFSGIADFLNRIGFDFADTFKRFLREPPSACRMGVLLVDAAASTSYAFEDWFKAHLSTKDGLWVGPGIDSQTAIGISFSTRFVPDAEMSAARGYAVVGGQTRLVHLASARVLSPSELER